MILYTNSYITINMSTNKRSISKVINQDEKSSKKFAQHKCTLLLYGKWEEVTLDVVNNIIIDYFTNTSCDIKNLKNILYNQNKCRLIRNTTIKFEYFLEHYDEFYEGCCHIQNLFGMFGNTLDKLSDLKSYHLNFEEASLKELFILLQKDKFGSFTDEILQTTVFKNHVESIINNL